MGAKGREDGVGDLCNLADLEFWFISISEAAGSQTERSDWALIWPACVFQVHLVAIFGVDSCFAVQSNMGSVRNSRCQFMLCLACGGSGVGASVQTAAAQTGGKKVAGTKTAKPPLKLASVQATAYLAQIYWSPPFCALLNLNNFAKANKVFCRFWCLGQRDANIEGVAV